MTNDPHHHGKTYEFGLKDRLRIAREQAGFGQREFEVATGISRGSISNYENGVTTPRRPVILTWAMATGFDAGWLETGTQKPSGPDGPEGLGLVRARRDSNPQPSDWESAAMAAA